MQNKGKEIIKTEKWKMSLGIRPLPFFVCDTFTSSKETFARKFNSWKEDIYVRSNVRRYISSRFEFGGGGKSKAGGC